MHFLLLFFSYFLLACGAPPQYINEGSESPALLALSSDTVTSYPSAINGFSYAITLSVQNLSTSVPADSLSAVSNLSAPFTYVGGSYPGIGGTCTSTLNPATTCTINLSLDPVSTGTFTSSIALNYYDGLANQTLDIDLSTTSRDPYPANLTLTPSAAHDFGVIAIGGFSDHSVTVNNTGEQTATAINFAGLVAPYSIVNNTCGVSLAANGSCNFTIRLTPTLQAVVNQTLSLNYNDGVAPQTVNKNVSGEGRVAGFLTIDEGLNFDYQIVNSGFSQDQTITIRNTGGGNATAISFSGLAAPFTEVSNNCPATLTPAATCQATVRFSPTATVVSNDVYDIDYYDGFNNQTSSPNFTGQGFATAPILSLFSPASSPSQQSTPTIRTSNIINGLGVRLYRDATCSNQVALGNAITTSLDLSPIMAEGSYQFRVRLEDSHGQLSSCSTSFVNYQYDNTVPLPPTNITFTQSYSSLATSTPTINWNASGSGDVVDYQVGVSTNPAGGNSDGGFTSKGNVTSATETGLAMVECQYYYASVQSIDHVGLTSATYNVSAASFRYDSAAPTAPSNLSEDGDGSTNNSATVTWNPSTDACGLSHYEVAISEDTNGNNTLDAGEIGNVVAFTNVGIITSHRFDSLVLTNGVAHYTSIRAMDTTGRYSTASVSDPWIVYDPSIELPNMILWLDSNDPSSILDNNGRDALDPLFNGQVDDWLDKSGSPVTHHFNAVNAGARPSYDPINFTVDYDGANTVMTTANHAEINTATVVQRNITVAFRTSADIASRQVLYEEGGNIRGMNIYIFNGQLYCGFYNDPGGVGGSDDPDVDQPFTWVNTALAPNTNYFVTWVFDYTNFPAPTGSLDCYLDGANFGSTTTTSRLFAHSGAVGLGSVNGQSVFEDGSVPASGNHFLGSIYEVMLFNNAPTGGDVTNVHTYLDNKWN